MKNQEGAAPLHLKKNSRSSRFASWSGEANSFRDKIFRSFYIFLLFAIDFVMFIYSVNGKLFENGTFNQAIGAILGGAFVFCFILIFCLSFSRTLQNVVCALVTTVITAVFFYQFALFDVNNFVEIWLNKVASWLTFLCFIPSAWLVGIVLGLFIFFAFRYSDAILFVTMVLLLSGVIGVQKNEMIRKTDTEYTEVKPLEVMRPNDKSEANLVYLMLPKLPSYQFLSSMDNLIFRDLRDLLLGFYAVNKFEVYPNAFVQNADTMSNIIDIFNQVDYTSSTSANRGYAEYLNKWDFVHGGLELLSLEDNQLYDYLKKNGYSVSMYAMPQFDFCLKGGDFNTNRCVVKGYKTVPLFDNRVSVEKNVYALLGEWLLSMKNREITSFAKMFLDMSSLKGYKVLSENRRVSLEGATELFDRLSRDYAQDRGDLAYLAYVDIPSDIFIYDEFCNVKPRKDWVALKDNSVYSGRLEEKQRAYVDQTKCLIGKLQEYMDDLNKQAKSVNTNIFIQGVSTVKELAPRAMDKYGQFVNDRLVNLAVHRGDNPRFVINANICLASDFTKTFLRYQDYCYTLDDMKMAKEDLYNVKKNLVNNAVIRSNKISNIVADYHDWYAQYQSKNVAYQKKMARQKEEELARKRRQENIDQRNNDDVGIDDADMPLARASEDNIFELTDDLAEEKVNNPAGDVESEAPVVEVAPTPENLVQQVEEVVLKEDKSEEIKTELSPQENVPDIVSETASQEAEITKVEKKSIGAEKEPIKAEETSAVVEIEPAKVEETSVYVEMEHVEAEKKTEPTIIKEEVKEVKHEPEVMEPKEVNSTVPDISLDVLPMAVSQEEASIQDAPSKSEEKAPIVEEKTEDDLDLF